MANFNLEIYTRTDELLNKIYPRLVNYPKAEKYSLCAEIKDNFYNLLKFMSLASSVKSKRLGYLQEADGYLQVIKTLTRLSLRRKYISKGFYKEIDEELTVINKMLVSWILATSKR